MTELPGALIVVDPNREDNAVKEARKMAIPTICLLDTDCDPDYAGHPPVAVGWSRPARRADF